MSQRSSSKVSHCIDAWLLKVTLKCLDINFFVFPICYTFLDSGFLLNVQLANYKCMIYKLLHTAGLFGVVSSLVHRMYKSSLCQSLWVDTLKFCCSPNLSDRSLKFSASLSEQSSTWKLKSLVFKWGYCGSITPCKYSPNSNRVC